MAYSYTCYKTSNLRLPVTEIDESQVISLPLEPAVMYREGTVMLSYDVVDTRSLLSSVIRESKGHIILNADSISTLPHDLVQAVVSPIPEGTKISGMTPDIVYAGELKYRVIEMATRWNASEDSLIEAVREKISKYKHIMDQMESFNVIAVGLSGVVSLSAEMDSSTVTKLVEAFKMGLRLRNSIYDTVGVSGHTKDMQKTKTNLAFFKTIQYPRIDDDTKCGMIMTPEWLRKANATPVKHVLKVGIKRYAFRKTVNVAAFLDNTVGKHDTTTVVHLPMIKMKPPTGTLTSVEAYHQICWSFFALDPLERDLREFRNTPVPDRVGRYHDVAKTLTRVDEFDRIEFAKRGVLGKSMRMNDEVLANRETSKIGYDGNCETSDIKAFLESPLVFNTDSVFDNAYFSQYQIKDNSKTDLFGLAENMCRTEEMHALLILQKIVNELCLSYKLNPEDEKSKHKYEFISKKVPGTDLRIMIRTTKGSGSDEPPTFFMICSTTPFSTVSDLFEEVHKTGEFYHTKFVMLNKEKMAHLTNILPTVLLHWVALTESFETNLMFYIQTRQAMRFYMLHLLEDKEYTSKAMSLMRYYYMELVGTGSAVRASKITSKFETPIRSRLALFTMQHIRGQTDLVVTDPNYSPDAFEEESAQDAIINRARARELTFEITTPWGAIAKTLDQLLFAMYVNHTHNKDEGNDFVGSKQIVEKLLKMEYCLKDATNRMGDFSETPDPQTYVDHDWSVRMVKKGARLFKSRIVEASESDIELKVMERLAKITMDLFATTKASTSSVFFGEVGTPEDTEAMQKRKKCFENMINLNFKHSHLLENLKEIVQLHFMFTGGRMLVTIFKKPQNTGVREILILDQLSRILVFCVEEIARTACQLHPFEMLTKPTQKLKLLDLHNEKMSEKKAEFMSTRRYSADKSTWCQMFVNSAFYVAMNEIFPQYSEIFTYVFNCHTRKNIELPVALVKAFLANPSSKLSSANADRLKKEFFGEHGVDVLLKAGGVIIRNESNMMQGIFHYVSSVLHCCALEYLILEAKKAAKKVGVEIIMTVECSSDDSGILITVLAPSADLALRFYDYFDRLLLAVDKGFCMKTSEEKTTATSKELFEFNSNFFPGNTMTPAIVKLLAPICYDSPAESLKQRIASYYASLRSLRADGATGELCSFASICQLMCVHNGYGLYNMSFYHDFIKPLRDHKLSILGSYVVLPPLLAGLVNADFCDFHACSSSALTKRIYSNLLTKPVKGHYISSEFSLSYRLWPQRKYRRAMSRLNIPLNYSKEKSFDDMSIFFRELETGPEYVEKIKINATSSGYARSFGFIGRVESVSTMAFMLWDKIFYLTAFEKDSFFRDDDTTDKIKLAEYNALDKLDQEEYERSCIKLSLEELVEEAAIAPDDKSLDDLFPLSSDFSYVLNLLGRNISMRRTKFKLASKMHYYANFESGLPTKQEMKNILKYFWYDDKSVIPKRTADSFSAQLGRLLPWWSEDRDECLTKSGLACPADLINQLAMFAKDSEPVKFVSRGYMRESTSLIESIMTLNMRKDTYANFTVALTLDEYPTLTGAETENVTPQFENRIRDWQYFLNSIENPAKYAKIMSDDLLHLIKLHENSLKTATLNSRSQTMALQLLSAINPSYFVDLLKAGNIVVSWPKPQKKDTTYYGLGEALIITKSGAVKIWVDGTQMYKIERSPEIYDYENLISQHMSSFTRSHDCTVSVVDAQIFLYPDGFVFSESKIWLANLQQGHLIRSLRFKSRPALISLGIRHLPPRHAALKLWLARENSMYAFNSKLCLEEMQQDLSLRDIKMMLADRMSTVTHHRSLMMHSQPATEFNISTAEAELDALFDMFEPGGPAPEDVEIVGQDQDRLFELFGVHEEANVSAIVYHPMLTAALKHRTIADYSVIGFAGLISEILIESGVMSARDVEAARENLGDYN